MGKKNCQLITLSKILQRWLGPRLAIWGSGSGGWEIRWGHWNGHWESSCGEWGAVGTIIIKIRPRVSSLGPFVKEGAERLTFVLHRLWQTKLTSKERVLLLLRFPEWADGYLPDILHWVELRVIALQKIPAALLWDWIWGDLRWHQTPCAVEGRIHAKAPCTPRSFRKETTLICFSFNSIRVPVILGQGGNIKTTQKC